MKGLDTNVLIRAITGDDPSQSPVTRELLRAGEVARETFYISTPVLCELVWSLRGKPYRLDRAAIAEILTRLLETRSFEVQSRTQVRRALELYITGPADFADYLIGEQNRRAGCALTVTFDRKLAGTPGFQMAGE